MDLFADVVQMIAAIDPTVAAGPVYIVRSDEWTDPTFDTSRSSAYTSPLLDLQMSSYLVSAGRWKGRGFATVLVEDCVTDSLMWVGGIVLHELAHHLTYPIPKPLPDEPGALEALARGSQTVIDYGNNVVSRMNAKGRLPPWYQHEIEFVRAAAHLTHRSTRRLHRMPLEYVRFSTPYYDVDESEFMAALGHELTVNEHVPIRTIIKSQPPRAFVELITSAMDAWHHHQQLNKEVA